MISIFLLNNPITPDPDILKTSEFRRTVFFDEIIIGYILVTERADKLLGFLDVSVASDDDSFIVQSIEFTKLRKWIFENSQQEIYEFKIPVPYPKRKLVDPFLILTAKFVPKYESIAAKDEHLPDFESHGRNLLDGWKSNTLFLKESKHDIGTNNVTANNTQDMEVEKPVKQSLKLRIMSPLIIKLKSTRPAGKHNILLSSFNIEMSETLRDYDPEMHIQLNAFHIDFNGNVTSLNDDSYPLILNSEESMNFNFRLMNLTEEAVQPLNIAIKLKVFKSNTHISNEIVTSWVPYVDFNLIAPPINSSLKYTTNNSTSSLSKKRVTTKRFNSMNSVMINLANANSNLFGLRLTFTGRLNVNLGEIVDWQLQAINTSFNKLNLSLVVNKLETSHSKITLNGHTSQSNVKATQLVPHPTPPIAPIQVNNTLPTQLTSSNSKALYESLKLEPLGILILNNDIRLNLEPNSVFEINLKIMGISKGIYNLEGVNIFDLNNGDCIDFGKLVEVFVI